MHISSRPGALGWSWFDLFHCGLATLRSASLASPFSRKRLTAALRCLGLGLVSASSAPAPRWRASAAGLSERCERLDQAGGSLAIGGIHIAEVQHPGDRIGHIAPQQPDRAAALVHKSHLD